MRFSGQTDKWTVEYGYIDSAVDTDQEYIYFMGSEMAPSKNNILFYLFFK